MMYSCGLAFAARFYFNAAGELVPEENPNQALCHRRILLGVDKRSAAPLASSLLLSGARPLWASLSTVSALEDESDLHPLDDAILRLSDFDFVLFSGQQAIRVFAERMRMLLSLDDMDIVAGFLRAAGSKFCTMSRDATTLKRFCGVTADITLLGSFQELSPHRADVRSRTLLIVGQSISYNEMGETERDLRAATTNWSEDGARLYIAPALRRVPADPDENAHELNLVSDGSVEAIVLDSVVAARSLVDGLAARGANFSKLHAQHQFAIAALNPLTLSSIRENVGVEADLEATSADEELVAQLDRWFNCKGGLIL